MVEPDVAVDAVLGNRLAKVREDLVAAGDRVLVPPRLELVAEGVQVGVRADAGIGEQVPGAARRAARLQDRVRLARLLLLQVVGGADAGDACADDQHVDVVRGLQSVWSCNQWSVVDGGPNKFKVHLYLL